jgi:hypothetical protein
MVAYLIIIIYKRQQTTKKIKKRHRKFEQEAALSGGCDVTDSLPPYISRTWSPVCLFGNRNSVRKPVRFLFWFYVREPICSRWESFDDRGSTVFSYFTPCFTYVNDISPFDQIIIRKYRMPVIKFLDNSNENLYIFDPRLTVGLYSKALFVYQVVPRSKDSVSHVT